MEDIKHEMAVFGYFKRKKGAENSGYTAGHGKCDRPCRAFVRPVEKAGRFSEKTGERGRKQPERDGPEHFRRDRHGGK